MQYYITRTVFFFVIAAMSLVLTGCADSNHAFMLNPPLSVKAEAGNARLNISWSPVAGAESYSIYVGTEAGSAMSGTRYDSEGAGRIITGLDNHSTYYMVVTARHGNVESPASREVSGTPLPFSQPPTSVNAVAGDGEVTLAWSTKGGESYHVYWSYSSTVSKEEYDGMISAAATPYSHNGLLNATDYYYVITAFNDYGESSESLVVKGIPSALSGNAVNMSGTVYYQDREYDRYGFTGIEDYKPVRYAIVEVVDSSSSAVLVSGTTDVSGGYDITFSASTSLSMYTRVISATSQAGEPEVEVLNLAGSLFSVGGVDVTAGPGMEVVSNLLIPLSQPVSGAFNILDVMTGGGEFVAYLSAALPPPIKAYWQLGNDYFGTWYCPAGDSSSGCSNGEGIYLLGGDAFGDGDHDEYDDDVILHEYAHFVSFNLSRDDSPGGTHYLTSNDIDLRLAWSEGWGDFFPAAFRRWGREGAKELVSLSQRMPDTLFVDDRGSAPFTFDVNEPTLEMVYASNEVAVANVLWKMLNGTLPGMDGIWGVVSDYIPNAHDASIPVNMEAFWDGWLYNEAPLPSERIDLEGFFRAREIDYSIDIFEPDSLAAPARKLAVGSSETHTLYADDNPAVSDGDYIAFDAIEGLSYVISTSELKNGADTYMRLIDRDGVAIMDENDNGIPDQVYTAPYNLSLLDGVYHENDGTTLASSIIFTPYSSGTFYLEVSPSTDRPQSAGRYGSYRLTLSTL